MSDIVLNGPGHPPIPDTEYTLEIVESAYEPNPEGTGMVLKCKAQVIEGELAGRLCELKYTLEHHDKARQERGQREFAKLRRATGALNPQDTEELHWRPFRVVIGVRDDTGANVIREYVLPPAA